MRCIIMGKRARNVVHQWALVVVMMSAIPSQAQAYRVVKVTGSTNIQFIICISHHNC